MADLVAHGDCILPFVVFERAVGLWLAIGVGLAASCASSRDHVDLPRFDSPDAGVPEGDQDRPNEAYDDLSDDLEDTFGETLYPDVEASSLPAEDPYVDPLPRQLAFDDVTAMRDLTNLPIGRYRSVLITEQRAMRSIGNRFPLGVLLNRVGKAAIRKWSKAAGQRSKFDYGQRNRWVRNPLLTAGNEFDAHNGLPFEQRLGMKHNGNPWRRAQDLWPQLENSFVGRGPFRLLAVVNRMDLAGDVDERGLIDAARFPRSFGEARLIFGLVDRDYETNRGKPYPMTFIIEYRLPALDDNYQPIDDYDYRGQLFNREEWRTQMQRWGELWRKLSSWDPAGNAADVIAFRRHLKRVVGRFARPENFVALRANVELKDDGKTEYELREWYMLRTDQWVLIPRKPRDEPYRCAEDGSDLGRLLEYYWDPNRGDLNMARLTPNDTNNVIGYNVPRTAGNSPIPIIDPISGCPRSNGEPILFEMKGTDGNGTSRVVAPFGRVKEDFVWNVADASEAQRHQFAMRTCTGCHGKEAGEFGFHVFPRLAGQRSKLSNFLTGGDGTVFTHGTHRYGYNEMAMRKSYLERASERAEQLQLFEGLYRHDQR